MASKVAEVSVARICHPCSGGKRQNSWSGSSVSHCIGSKVVDLPLSRHSRDGEEAQRQFKVDVHHQWIKWMPTATSGKVNR